MVRRPGDPAETPAGGGAAERLRQFVDEHFDEDDRPDSLPDAAERDEGDDSSDDHPEGTSPEDTDEEQRSSRPDDPDGADDA